MPKVVIDYAEVIDGIIKEVYRLREAEDLLKEIDLALFLGKNKPFPDEIRWKIDDFFRRHEEDE